MIRKEKMEAYNRTNWCGELNEEHLGKEVSLLGWVNRVRDHGGVIFVDLRDREGLVQVVFNPGEDSGLHLEAGALRNEYVISVEGKVSPRPEGTINDDLPSGRVEVTASRLNVLNASEVPVFVIDDELNVDEGLRLRYRYLDLRRPVMQKRLMTRHRCFRFIRSFLDERRFVEIETPTLTRSTPEGARDYLVPSRVNPGGFYSLPQSPQLFKQLLMVSGFEKYYQIARCFRDEDLRADRQPEFTQLDLEMSFVGEREVMGLIEELMAGLLKEAIGVEVPLPIPVMTYREAMDRYGSDSPDTRFGLELFDAGEVARGCRLEVFRKVVEKGGVVKGLCLPDGAGLSRKEMDDLTALVVEWGGKGLAWLKYRDGWSGPVAKFFSEEELSGLKKASSAEEGSCLFLVADDPGTAPTLLGRLRLHLARRGEMIPGGLHNFVWVTEFPLVEYDPEADRHVAVHHPFTSPYPEDIPLLGTEPLKARARAYDLVLNGQEIGGGSIRIHRKDIQMKMFELLGISTKEVGAKFGFLLEAFGYGAPPHGGIALGLDRLVAILCEVDSIREVIAFPKTQKAACPLTGAPSEVSPEQLRELHIRILPSARREDP